MKKFDNLTFTELKESDIYELIPIMTRAFDEDTRIHLGKPVGGPPGYDNGDFLRKYALDEKATSYKVIHNEKTVGAVILWINQETNENFLGNVFVDVDLENRGIGKKIWDFIESAYPHTKVWKTETPIFSRRNHNFYVNKCGFHVVKIQDPKDLENGSFILEKVMSVTG